MPVSFAVVLAVLCNSDLVPECSAVVKSSKEGSMKHYANYVRMKEIK